MHRSFVAELSARRTTIKHAWERKLRHEPVTSPLANPDTLVLLMDRTLEDLGAALALRCRAAGGDPSAANRALRSGCLCGLNPLLAYFRVAASVLPTVMAGGAEQCPELNASAYAACLQEMQTELHALAMEEIRDFCATCQTEIARGGRVSRDSAQQRERVDTITRPLAIGAIPSPRSRGRPRTQRDRPATESANTRSR